MKVRPPWGNSLVFNVDNRSDSVHVAHRIMALEGCTSRRLKGQFLRIFRHKAFGHVLPRRHGCLYRGRAEPTKRQEIRLTVYSRVLLKPVTDFG